ALGLVPGVGVRGYLALGEAADLRAQRRVLVGLEEVRHGAETTANGSRADGGDQSADIGCALEAGEVAAQRLEGVALPVDLVARAEAEAPIQRQRRALADDGVGERRGAEEQEAAGEPAAAAPEAERERG